MPDLYQVALGADPKRIGLHKGRGVRFTILSPMERDRAYLKAASLIESTPKQGGLTAEEVAKLQMLQWHAGVCAMLRQTTKKDGLTADQINDPATEWRALTDAEISTDYDKLFSARDDQILLTLFREYHEVSRADLEAVTGKVRMVSTD